MSFNKKFFATGGIVASSSDAVCNTDTTDIFDDGNGVALYSLDYDASTAQDAATDYSGTPSNVTFGVGGKINFGARFVKASESGVLIAATATTPINYASRVFSIAFWIKLPNISTSAGSHQVITKYGSTDSPNTRAASIIIHTDGRVRLLERNSLNQNESRYSTTTLTANNWHHVVVARSTTGVAFYIDGEQKHNADALSFNFTPASGGTEPIRFGRNASGTVSYGEFDLDQVRFFTSTLTEANAATLYAETACVHDATANTADFPTGATAVAHYPLDNSSKDNKGTNDGTETDIEYRFGKYGQAAVFNGTSSEITASSFTSLSQVGISMWVNMPDISQQAGLIARYGTNREFAIYMYSGNLTASIYYNGNNGNATTITTSTYMSNNTWHHIAYTANGSTAPKLYIDGSEVGTPQHTDAAKCAYYTSSEPLDIGHFAGISTYNYEGKIDQVRIYSLAITSSQVTELYNEKPETDTSNFKTVLYEGDGSTQYISNVGFQPDFVWIKERTNASAHALYDLVRGKQSVLLSNGNNNATDQSSDLGLESFDANGFFVDYPNSGDFYINRSSQDYVAWVWKAGGDAVSGTGSGVTNVSVSANTAAGFSIVKYTGGNSASDTVNHGLTDAEMIILKDLDDGTNNWRVWHKDLTANHWLYLNLTNAQASAASDGGIRNVDSNSFGFINSTSNPDSVGIEGVNSSSSSYIAYVWKSISGYSKIGNYTSTGSAGLQITGLGFAPSFVMIKNTGDTGSWIIHSKPPTTTNPSVYHLRANSNASKDSGANEQIDFDSNGFTLNGTGQNINHSDEDTYIYMAFK